MADISKIKLPSNNVYDIKDATARSTITSEVSRLEGLINGLTTISFVMAWNGTSTPVVVNIPAGVTVTYNGTTYTGTMTAASADEGAFYLVSDGVSPDAFEEYVIMTNGGTKQWEKIGDTNIDLSFLLTNVELDKATDVVLGESTTFSASGGQSVYANPLSYQFVDSFDKKGTSLVTTTIPHVSGLTTVQVPQVSTNQSYNIPNVTSVGTASTFAFQMGSGNDAETLIISGSNSTAPTLGTAITATNTVFATNVQADKVNLGTPITAATGKVKFSEDTTEYDTFESVGSVTKSYALIGLGNPTHTQPTINVGTNDKVTVLTSATDLDLTYGS